MLTCREGQMKRHAPDRTHNSFALLGVPRSGTNYLSSLMKAHPDIELQIEPFSLHTRSFLLEDLEPNGRAAAYLSGDNHHPFVEDLLCWLNEDTKPRGSKRPRFLLNYRY